MNEWKGFLPPNAIVMAKKGAKPGVGIHAGTRANAMSPSTSQPMKNAAASPSAQATTPPATKPTLIFVGDSIQGQSAQLLDKMIEAMGVARSDVSIVSPQKAAELDSNLPHVFVTLGDEATKAMLPGDFKSLRGQFHPLRGSKVIPTYHPTELNKSPTLKKDAWSDLQKVIGELGIAIPKKK